MATKTGTSHVTLQKMELDGMSGSAAGAGAKDESPNLGNEQQVPQDQPEETGEEADADMTPNGNGVAEDETGAVANDANETSDNSVSLLHDPGIKIEWTAEEQSTLEEGMSRFADETSFVMRYIKIANLLPNKTARDVAMRCKWMLTNESGKRRKQEDQAAGKKNKEKKNHVKAGVANNTRPSTIDNDDGISIEAIGGTTGQYLEQNNMLISQIRANLAGCKLQENTDHFMKFRDNLFSILNGFIHMPGIMSQMPPLPVKLNTELADTILPRSIQRPPPT